MRKYLNVQHLLWLALVLALVGSLKHLASIFASVDQNHFMGWLQAIAIDAGLFSLAYSIRQRKVDKRPVRQLWLGVVLFTLISIYGNLAYGVLSTSGQLPVWMSVIKPIVLAASLPVLVLYLAELVSDNHQFEMMVAEKQAKKQVKTPSVQENEPNLDRANDARQSKVSERRQMVLSLLDSGLSDFDIAGQLDVSLKTIQRDIKSLNGQVRNG
jgi:hypothetical protein